MDPIYYLITFICVAGGCYTGFMLGRRNGIESFLSYLESQKNKEGLVKLKFVKDDGIELVQ